MSEYQPVGPVEVAILAFPGSRFKGDIVPTILDLVERGIVTILDVVVVSKTEGGDIVSVELADLDDDPFASVDGEVTGIVSDEDILAAGALLEPGSTAAMIVWENTWARPLVGAITGAGGFLVAHDRLDADTVNRALAYQPT